MPGGQMNMTARDTPRLSGVFQPIKNCNAGLRADEFLYVQLVTQAIKSTSELKGILLSSSYAKNNKKRYPALSK